LTSFSFRSHDANRGEPSLRQGGFMAEPASDAPDCLEAAVEQAIAICDGDVRAALRAMLVANSFLPDEVERLARGGLFRLRTRKDFARSESQ
jgi:hypothetical protein